MTKKERPTPRRGKGELSQPKRENAARAALPLEPAPLAAVEPDGVRPGCDTETAGTQAEAERVLAPSEIADFRERYGLEPGEFDALYRTARKEAPQYGIDYAIDLAALKERLAALKKLVARGDAPGARASLLAEALLAHGAVADARARAAALKRKT